MGAAFAKLPDDATHVILHDAARPAVAYTDLEALFDAAESHDSIALTKPLRSSLVELDEAQQPVGYRGVSEFSELLTPQAFSRDRLKRCVAEKNMPHASELHLLHGSPLNIRVGSAADGALVKAMISLLPKPKIKPSNSPFEEAQW
jgi:2-C-methyl-D-erythritol 4-phosphate cytidylyltransferase